MKARSFRILLLIVLFLLVQVWSSWERIVGNLLTMTTTVQNGAVYSEDDSNKMHMDDPHQGSSSSSSFPPLDSLIRNDQIIGDVQFLLDFAIVGHSKTGTSAQLKWLRKHPQVQMGKREWHILRYGQPAKLVKSLYSLPQNSTRYKRGYKCPTDVIHPISLQALHHYWPRTKLIVGIRHPVKWFESYHNYNTRKKGRNLAPAETMIGSNMPEKVLFHKHLALLGKTIASGMSFDKEQYEMLGWNETFASWPPPKMTNPIFLYDSSQPFDMNTSRAAQYARDMTDFLGLENPPLQALVAHEARHQNYHFGIDICNDTFTNLRAELMEVARNASTWIKDYFMDHPDVTVSSPDHFKNGILASWDKDPCQ